MPLCPSPLQRWGEPVPRGHEERSELGWGSPHAGLGNGQDRRVPGSLVGVRSPHLCAHSGSCPSFLLLIWVSGPCIGISGVALCGLPARHIHTRASLSSFLALILGGREPGLIAEHSPGASFTSAHSCLCWVPGTYQQPPGWMRQPWELPGYAVLYTLAVSA